MHAWQCYRTHTKRERCRSGLRQLLLYLASCLLIRVEEYWQPQTASEKSRGFRHTLFCHSGYWNFSSAQSSVFIRSASSSCPFFYSMWRPSMTQAQNLVCKPLEIITATLSLERSWLAVMERTLAAHFEDQSGLTLWRIQLRAL